MDYPHSPPKIPIYWWIPPLLFLFHYLLTSFLNRPASDDFEFMSLLNEQGILGSVLHFYHTWNTRWAAIGFLNVILTTGQWLNTWFWYHLMALLLLWAALFRIIGSLTGLDRMTRWLLAGYTTMALFYSLFSIPQTLFWLNTSAMYFWSLIALLTAIGAHLNPKNKSITMFVMLLTALYIGGAYEPLAITLIVALVFYLMFKIRQTGSWTGHSSLLLFLCCLIISFLVGYAGEGNRIRASWLPQTDWDYKLMVVGKSLIKMFFMHGLPKLFLALLLSFPWMLLVEMGWVVAPSSRSLKRATLLLILLMVVSLAPISWLMSEMGPERALSQVSLYLTGYAALFMAWLGGKWRVLPHGRKIAVAYISLISLFLAHYGYNNLMADLEYVNAYDKRMERLIRYRDEGFSGLVTVPQLPSPGWLYSAEIDTAAGHYTCRHLQNYLMADYQIVRGSPQNW